MKATVIFCINFILLLNKSNSSMTRKFAGGVCHITNIFYPKNVMSMFITMPEQFYSLDFEVFGIVQGVFFRKHTEKQAKSLGLTGWCRNTEEGTVKGTVEGDKANLNKMKHWLEKTGSPSSRIDKAIFSEITSIPQLAHKGFAIRK